MMKVIIDRVSSPEASENLFAVTYIPAIIYVLVSFLIGAVQRFYDWVSMNTFPKMKTEVIAEMFDYVEGHSYSYFQHNFAGSLANKINDMAKGITRIIDRLISDFLGRFLCFIVGAATMYLVNPYFAFVLITWGVIFIAVSLLCLKRAQKYSEIFSEAKSKIVGKVVDSLSNILNIKLFSRNAYESRYLRATLADTVAKDKKLHWYLLKVKTFYGLSITVLIGCMTWLLIYERSQNRVTIGDFTLIFTLTMVLIDQVYFLATELVDFAEDIGMCKQALSVVSSKNEIVDCPNAAPLQVPQGEIMFNKVHFRYKKASSIFTDKSIVINPGEKVGLVGFSGSGKSTFVNLILRFFDIDSGQILIDGQDIKKVTQESLRSHIAMIPQDPVLFHRTLMENIRYGRIEATDAEVIECSKKAHCHEFIEKLAEGYQALVGERGVKLSGGQRQRIAIARALLKNAPILILDEATSSLDSVTENYIQESLKLLMCARTTIVIAHRLSTLFDMDRILVFCDGSIVEDGTHKELIAIEDGHYAELWNMQAGGFFSEKVEE